LVEDFRNIKRFAPAGARLLDAAQMGGVALAANQSPDRDPTRGFVTTQQDGYDSIRTASIPHSKVNDQIGNVPGERAPPGGQLILDCV